MKSRKIIITIIIITALVLIIVLRLGSNKRDFDEQLRMITEFNTTVPVIIDTVKYEQISTEFSVNGYFLPLYEISIISETQGNIISISAKLGDKVKSGQVLASTENELIASQLDLTKFNLEKAEKDMQRFEKLSKGDAVTMQECELAKQIFMNAKSDYIAVKTQFENTQVKAPFDGIITKQSIEKGTCLFPGSPVFDIAEINKVKIIAKLTSKESMKLKKGQIVSVSVENYPGVLYEGTILAIGVKSDFSKRYDVEVEVINHSDNTINPGMFGTVIFNLDSEKQMLVIQRKALTGSIKNPEVFIVKGDSVMLHSVNVVSLTEKYIEVKSGLKEGDKIVISGQINLVNGTKITLNK